MSGRTAARRELACVDRMTAEADGTAAGFRIPDRTLAVPIVSPAMPTREKTALVIVPLQRLIKDSGSMRSRAPKRHPHGPETGISPFMLWTLALLVPAEGHQ